MPITFRTTPIIEPFTFDSIGNHWNQEAVIRPKGHPLYHYIQSEKGTGECIIQGTKYHLHEDEGFLIAPFIPHSYDRLSKDWYTCFITFTGVLENSIAKMLGNRQTILIEKEQGTQINSLISKMMNQCETGPTDTKSLSIDCYNLLMYFVDGVYTYDLLNDPLYIRYVEPIVKEIETHYDKELTVQNLSSQVYITPQYLSRLFGRFLGCSVYEYITTYRISKAKELLLMDSHMQVGHIAEHTGYLDTSHFIAIFKKITGMTPLEFRKLN